MRSKTKKILILHYSHLRDRLEGLRDSIEILSRPVGSDARQAAALAASLAPKLLGREITVTPRRESVARLKSMYLETLLEMHEIEARLVPVGVYLPIDLNKWIARCPVEAAPSVETVNWTEKFNNNHDSHD